MTEWVEVKGNKSKLGRGIGLGLHNLIEVELCFDLIPKGSRFSGVALHGSPQFHEVFHGLHAFPEAARCDSEAFRRRFSRSAVSLIGSHSVYDATFLSSLAQ